MIQSTVETRSLKVDGTRRNTSIYPKLELKIGSLKLDLCDKNNLQIN